jgi:predicted Fe-Mo cluster-binding NifX family protein
MRIGVAVHEGRVSPVLDVAQRLLVIDVDGHAELVRQEVPLAGAPLTGRVREIQRSGAAVLICGAVSWPLEAALASAGIRVVPRVCGPVNEVLAAFLAGRLAGPEYLMPGCCRRRARHRGMRAGGWHNGGVGRGRRYGGSPDAT